MQPTLLLDESQAMRVFVDATRALSYTRPTESHWLSGPSQLMSRSWKWYSGLLLTIAISSVSHADDAEGLAFFQKKVLPVLKKHCYECHSAAADEIKGNLPERHMPTGVEDEEISSFLIIVLLPAGRRCCVSSPFTT